jgi:hypothetical protein
LWLEARWGWVGGMDGKLEN